jgi:DNA-directed RNA polymerase subunit F
MVLELNRLLSQVMTAKRDLKRVYYTSRNEETKLDVKDLVASVITLQRLLEELITLKRRHKVAKKVLADRKAELTVRKWVSGLPRRSKDFVEKSRKVDQTRLRRYQEPLMKYIESIGEELAKWIEDIHTLTGIPRVPRR